MTDQDKKEARLKFEKVICPKHARPNHPVTISVTGTRRKNLIVSLSAPLLGKTGLVRGTEVCAYVNRERQMMIQIEGGADARPLRSTGSGSRLFLEFPLRPFSKLLPDHLYSTPAELVSAKKGEFTIALPVVEASAKKGPKA